jgi:hypothetical protein
MPIIQMVPGRVRQARVRRRAPHGLRRAALLFGVVGLTAGAGLLTAGSALALNGSEPGNLILTPASGAAHLQPTWSTKDGCPAGYQGSAQLSEFNTNGTYASAISSVIASPVAAFHGTLLGNVGGILGVTNITKGKTVEFAIGCYSGVATSGKVKYVQSTFLTLSSSGSSYSTSSGNPQPGSSSGQGGSSSGQAGSNSGQAGSNSGQADAATAANTSGMSTQVEAAWIAGACGLAVALTGLAWNRRRNRSRLP